MAKIDEHGREILDDTPRALPLRFRQQSWAEQMRAFVQNELSRMAESHDAETFEEADDFWIDEDDTLPRTEYELTEEYVLPLEPDPEPSAQPGSETAPSQDDAKPQPEPGVAEG